mmetsp:Transcript_38227/g.123713  ORF Transcript_38227/g.123713 Transcript_38227/m.123713 type:complete len:203 (+) Transcript_38227:363-971(+)
MPKRARPAMPGPTSWIPQTKSSHASCLLDIFAPRRTPRRSSWRSASTSSSGRSGTCCGRSPASCSKSMSCTHPAGRTARRPRGQSPSVSGTAAGFPSVARGPHPVLAKPAGKEGLRVMVCLPGSRAERPCRVAGGRSCPRKPSSCSSLPSPSSGARRRRSASSLRLLSPSRSCASTCRCSGLTLTLTLTLTLGCRAGALAYL